MKRLKCALACAALSLFGLGAARTSGEFSGTWEDAWNDASRPGETTDFAEGGLAADFDSRVAGVGAWRDRQPLPRQRGIGGGTPRLASALRTRHHRAVRAGTFGDEGFGRLGN